MDKNQLYFGDCLAILKELNAKHPGGFIDLTYIDPPFNSKRNYNVLFEEANIKDAVAQKEAFADTWSNVSYKDTIEEIQDLDLDLFKFLQALDSIRISKSAMAYLSTMAIRIYYIQKVLKDTGSFYLHCDPTMSHYLKLICDLVFGEKNFQNEICWRRATSGSSKAVAKRFGSDHDVIFFYSKSAQYSFNKIFLEYPEYEIKKRFKNRDERGHYKDAELATYSQEKLALLKEENRLIVTKTGKLRYKIYLDDIKGVLADDVWIDIFPINSQAKERLGYPTQKPEVLLERIINASTKEGDLVADFFCGCGTTIAAAQKLKRKWLGADISHLAIGLIERRLIDSYGINIKKTFEVHGLPKDVASAKRLAEDSHNGRLGFQDWIIETMLNGIFNPKKTADGGWDGYLTFQADKKETVLIEVKSGNVNVKNMREFCDVIKNEKASAGVFVCFQEQVTNPMQIRAKEEGYYNKELFGTTYDKIQIITVEDLLHGLRPNFPKSTEGTFKKAQRKETGDGTKQEKLF